MAADTPRATTLDRFLDGRLLIEQSARGYRAAIDPVFLAAAVPASAGQSAFEAGAGTGVASLCLAKRVPGLIIDALENDAEALGLLAANIQRNDESNVVAARRGDIFEAEDAERFYDLVFSNPPYFERARATAPADPEKARAHLLEAGGLELWIRAMLRRMKPKGALTLILPAEALDRALRGLDEQAGALVIFPLWPKTGAPARRILLEARKGSGKGLTVAAGLVLHQATGAYTPEAEKILREGSGLKLSC